MNGKDRGDERAAPKSACHWPEDQKKEDDCDCMQQDVGQVVSGWVKAIKLAIQHVRERGNRVPVIGVDVRKRPDDISEAQARLNRGIGIDIILVVVIDEVMPERLAKNGPGN